MGLAPIDPNAPAGPEIFLYIMSNTFIVQSGLLEVQDSAAVYIVVYILC
jgi:hypothetical protein